MTKADTDDLGGLLQHRRDHAGWHAPSIANLRPQRRPLRPKHPFFGACGRGGLHVEHNTDNPAHNPTLIGGFYDHRTPMTACRTPMVAIPPRQQEQRREQDANLLPPHTTTGHELAGSHPSHRRRRPRRRGPMAHAQHREPTLKTSSTSPQTPLFGACGRRGPHVEHNTDNPAHNPTLIGGFTTIEPP